MLGRKLAALALKSRGDFTALLRGTMALRSGLGRSQKPELRRPGSDRLIVGVAFVSTLRLEGGDGFLMLGLRIAFSGMARGVGCFFVV